MPFGTGPILAPVDIGSNPEAALDWATAVARLMDRDLEIYFAAPNRKDEPLLREELQALTRYAQLRLPKDRQANYYFDLNWDPSTGIVDAAKHGGHCLIVQVTRERSALERLLQGSTTDDVISKSPCPVLAIPDDLPLPTGAPFKHILTATDLGAYGPMAMTATLSHLTRAGLTYLYVVDAAHAHLPELAIATDPEASFDQVVIGSRKALNTYLHEHPEVRPNGPFDVEIAVGDSVREITRHVKAIGHDLVIAGHHQRGLLAKLLLGSVAEEVLHRADVPVLIVPDPPAEAAA